MKSLIVTGIFAASLALTGSAAMAAPTQSNPIPHAALVSHARPATFAAVPQTQPRAQLNADIGQFVQSMLIGGPVPYANLVRDVRNMSVSAAYRGRPNLRPMTIRQALPQAARRAMRRRHPIRKSRKFSR